MKDAVDPVSGFRKRDRPSGTGPDGRDSPGTHKADIPRWMKVVVFVHIGVTYGIVMAHGLEDVPLSLEEAPLTALVVSGLGSSVGLVYKRVAEVLGPLLQGKTGL